MKTLFTFLTLLCLVISFNSCSESDSDEITNTNLSLLYLRDGDPADWTISGEVYSNYEEIQHWIKLGFDIETMNLTTTNISESILDNYNAVRIFCGALERLDSEGEAIFNWVSNGGSLFAQLDFSQPINLFYRFGIQDIEGEHGGLTGLDWYYHGAPWVFGPVTGPMGTVNSMAAASMDRPILENDHNLTVDASIDGYPIVVHGEFGAGKIIVVFAGHWNFDEEKPNNAYRATIFQENNIQFLENCIDYLK